MDDFEAKIGNESEGAIVGKYGLETRNKRGESHAQFCTEKNMCLMNFHIALIYVEITNRRRG